MMTVTNGKNGKNYIAYGFFKGIENSMMSQNWNFAFRWPLATSYDLAEEDFFWLTIINYEFNDKWNIIIY